MSVGILIVTHGEVGEAMIRVAEFILGRPLTGVDNFQFVQSETHTTGSDELRAAISENDEGNGVLILTDLVGASPANLVSDLLPEFQATMVTGMNLAMLLRVLNYRNQPLDVLTGTAADGAIRGIETFS
jgi:PTS system ascorbate-specific IIA component